MKYNVNNLYFAKCRHFIMGRYYQNGKEVIPKPDYIDYYTILLIKEDKFIDIFNKKNVFTFEKINNTEKSSREDLIIELNYLTHYIGIDYKTINKKECNLVENTIEKTKKLQKKYGYKKI